MCRVSQQSGLHSRCAGSFPGLERATLSRDCTVGLAFLARAVPPGARASESSYHTKAKPNGRCGKPIHSSYRIRCTHVSIDHSCEQEEAKVPFHVFMLCMCCVD